MSLDFPPYLRSNQYPETRTGLYKLNGPAASLVPTRDAINALVDHAEGQSGFSVSNLAALTSLDDTGMDEGAAVWVTTLRCNWYRVVEADPGTADGITNVRSSSGTATWYRSSDPCLSWAYQAAWKIDPVNGSDQAVGSPAAPIQTWAEFARRVRKLAVTMTVTVTSTCDPIIGSFGALADGLTLNIDGTLTSVATTGAVTTFTAPVKTIGACAQGTMTSGNIPDFTAHVGRFVFINGAPAYVAPILGVDGGGAPYLPAWAAEDYTILPALAGGSMGSVVTLTNTPTLQLSLSGGLTLFVRYFRFTSTDYADAVAIDQPNANAGVTFFACDFGGYLLGCREAYYLACQISRTGGAPPLMYSYYLSTWYGGGSRDRAIVILEGTLILDGFISQGGDGVFVGNSTEQLTVSALAIGGNGVTGLGVFGAALDGVWVGSGGTVVGGILYGDGNTGYGLKLGFGGRVQVSVAPTITGTAGDLEFCGAATAIPPLVGGAGVPAASALTTWAQHAAAPFGGKVMNYSNGTVLAVGA